MKNCCVLSRQFQINLWGSVIMWDFVTWLWVWHDVISMPGNYCTLVSQCDSFPDVLLVNPHSQFPFDYSWNTSHLHMFAPSESSLPKRVWCRKSVKPPLLWRNWPARLYLVPLTVRPSQNLGEIRKPTVELYWPVFQKANSFAFYGR